MPLLLVDLDNTLIDRDAAFRRAAADFLAGHGLGGTELAWLMELDASGYAPREVVATAIMKRYAGRVPDAAVGALLDGGGAEHVVVAGATASALRTARRHGWTCVIVTNGRTAQQEAKIRRAGLDRLVHGWVVSEAAGHRKPAPEIFHRAAGVAGLPLAGAWVVGDSPHADVAGAVAAGIRSAWVSHGRPWGQAAYRPVHVAATAAAAIHYAVRAPDAA